MGLLSKVFGSRKVTTTADHPLVLPRPALGFLNLKGADGERMMEADARMLAPLFSRVEKGTQSAPRCEVLFIYCDLDAAGKVTGSAQGIRDLIKSAGAYVAVVASENPPESYIQGTKVRNDWGANIAMVLDRKSDKLALFFRRLFEAMFGGKSMLLAWVALAPQASGHEDPDAPGMIMAAEAGHIVFAK